MKHQGQARREKLKFNGRELIDGVPHLTWAFDGKEGKGRHRADAPDCKLGCAADDFKKATVQTGLTAPRSQVTGSALPALVGAGTPTGVGAS